MPLALEDVGVVNPMDTADHNGICTVLDDCMDDMYEMEPMVAFDNGRKIFGWAVPKEESEDAEREQPPTLCIVD